MSEQDKLPFYDEDETMAGEEQMDISQSWGEYQGDLRIGMKPKK